MTKNVRSIFQTHTGVETAKREHVGITWSGWRISWFDIHHDNVYLTDWYLDRYQHHPTSSHNVLFFITRGVHKVSFPGDVYRNKTQFNENVYYYRYSKCLAIFQHIHLRNRGICQTMRPTFAFLCRRSLPPGTGTTVWHSSPPLCHSENADTDRTGISWGVRKDGNHWARGPGYRVNSCTRCVDDRAVCGRALSCGKTTPALSIPCCLFWMARRNFCSVSQ